MAAKTWIELEPDDWVKIEEIVRLERDEDSKQLTIWFHWSDNVHDRLPVPEDREQALLNAVASRGIGRQKTARPVSPPRRKPRTGTRRQR